MWVSPQSACFSPRPGGAAARSGPDARYRSMAAPAWARHRRLGPGQQAASRRLLAGYCRELWIGRSGDVVLRGRAASLGKASRLEPAASRPGRVLRVLSPRTHTGRAGAADQLVDGVAELLGATGVDRREDPGRIDHEGHDRVVLEDRPPLVLFRTTRPSARHRRVHPVWSAYTDRIAIDARCAFRRMIWLEAKPFTVGCQAWVCL